MNKRKIAAVIGAAAIAGGTALFLSTGNASADEIRSIDDLKSTLKGTVSDGQLEAMKDHLGTTADGVYERLAVDKVTGDIEKIASEDFAGKYGGTWTNPQGTGTIVAITDPALVEDVEELGAKAEVVDSTMDELEKAKNKLDSVDVPEGVYSWSIDVMENSLKVAGDPEAAKSFIEDAGVKAIIDEKAEEVKPLEDIVGGTEYGIDNQSLCSVGFSVTGPDGDGFLTAGHCGSTGASVTSGTGQGGSFKDSVFPGSDYAYVDAGDGWTVSPNVEGSDQAVADSTEAEIGAEVCRSGRTTGWQCGSIQEKDASVTYPQGTVDGMTGTDACAEPGDSGGSFISGASAQGMTSGGSGDCSSGGQTYFFPVTDALSATGTELTVG
ncbi:S1 family peptidase [Stackebrandtia nassauensis]|uniref:Peptidase S1 and S6 chymotrypsin/Hap n=1 Tax=Stackebrandtia nassauensis (strain DSM 44728 / CIP 108903 / NRRL B-16338 / NBRC 102104 / LLR-40K-21) TaxID=446470 RepID=D3PWB2_STANL|nr:S1 family peptidase [Stackebrandtia nassauensis]ADD41269.1 peptidase S1 and S6 chymotrypsin/Hap [Stackebrandtia nassauensis DSM 44728]